MKSIISLSIILACVPALGASGFEEMSRAAAFEISGIPAVGEVFVPAVPAAADNGFPPAGGGAVFKGAFCWQRGKNADAERMGMPFSFCVDSMRIIGGLFDGPRLSISGNSVNGVFELKVGPPSDGLYKSTAVVFRKSVGASCSGGEDAYIEFSVLADARGQIAADPFIRAFYGSTSDLCGAQWKYSAVKYVATQR